MFRTPRRYLYVLSRYFFLGPVYMEVGDRVGEVTRLAVVEKWPAFTCKLTTPGSRGDFT